MRRLARRLRAAALWPDVLLTSVDNLIRGIFLVAALVVVMSLAVLWFGVRDQRRGDEDAELWEAIDRWNRP